MRSLMDPESTAATQTAREQRVSNRRTAWILLSVAIVFFLGIICTRLIGGGVVGIGVMGTVAFLFLVIAIGRNLRSARTESAESRSASEARR